MPNIENINKIIDWIKADQARHFRMSSWVCELDDQGKTANGMPHKYVECHTAFCIAGYANLLRRDEAELSPLQKLGDPETPYGNNFYNQFSSMEHAENWLRIEHSHGISLFLMDGEDQREAFDNMPNEIRAQIAINVLTILRDENRVDWRQAALDAGVDLPSEDDDDDDDDDF